MFMIIYHNVAIRSCRRKSRERDDDDDDNDEKSWLKKLGIRVKLAPLVGHAPETFGWAGGVDGISWGEI